MKILRSFEELKKEYDILSDEMVKCFGIFFKLEFQKIIKRMDLGNELKVLENPSKSLENLLNALKAYKITKLN